MISRARMLLAATAVPALTLAVTAGGTTTHTQRERPAPNATAR